MWVSTHPSFWRQTAESGCSSSNRPPCLHQCHGRYNIKNTDVRQSKAPTSPLSDGDEKNMCTKVTQMKRETPQKWIVTAVLEQISSPLMLLSVRVALEGQEHNKICFQPRSLSQLSYPWVWYPPPFPLCSLWPLSLSLSIAICSLLSNEGLPHPCISKTSVKVVAFRGHPPPNFTQCRPTRAIVCIRSASLLSWICFRAWRDRTTQIQREKWAKSFRFPSVSSLVTTWGISSPRFMKLVGLYVEFILFGWAVHTAISNMPQWEIL